LTVEHRDLAIELGGEGQECAIGSMPAGRWYAGYPPAQVSRLSEMDRF